MNLTTTTKTVTEHTLVLSEADIERYLADPWQFREDLLASQKNGGVVA